MAMKFAEILKFYTLYSDLIIFYSTINFGVCMLQNTSEHKTLFDLAMHWKELLSSDSERLLDAMLTSEFWRECPPKLAVSGECATTLAYIKLNI